MKTIRYFFIVAMVLMAATSFGQAPNKFNYQGIARNQTGAPLQQRAISLKISIHDSIPAGTTVYEETQAVTTNNFGLYHIAIGEGNVLTGSMSEVD